ncbi:hypothetical protein N9I12_00070 [Gammaproteobacteria bacterium]|nr:hypothetical protein [Gammaproteobacteria bacterium]
MRLTKNSISQVCLAVIIILLTTSFSFALGEGDRNLLLIGVMAISPIIVLLHLKLYQSDLLLILFMVSIVTIPIINQPDSFRLSTVLYSMLFGFTFLAYKRLLYRSNFSIKNYQNLLRYLIYAYFLVLLIQQFSVLFGLPILNINNYLEEAPWKLNSLAAEPSHSARIVAVLFFCFILVKEMIMQRKYNIGLDLKNDKLVWLSFLWTMLTMGSATAILFAGLILLRLIKTSSFIAIIIGISLFINFTGIIPFNRIAQLFMAISELDRDVLIAVDHSASVRIVPILIVFEIANITSVNGWFGYGIDYVSTILYREFPGIPENYSGGGLFQLWVEYGFVSFLLFVIFSFSSVYKKGEYLLILFWLMLIATSGINSQIVWLTIILFMTNKYYYKTTTKQVLHANS